MTLATGPELCVSDGTADGTDILLDINLSGSSNPTLLTVYEDILVFKAIASSFVGYELWYTDGSESGTRKLSPNISPLDNPLDGALEFTKYKNELYFTAGEAVIRRMEIGLQSISPAQVTNGTKSFSVQRTVFRRWLFRTNWINYSILAVSEKPTGFKLSNYA